MRNGVEKLQLNDAALTYEPESSPALGFGLRCGFLGLLHMDIVQERLEREHGLDIIVTAPSVAYRAVLTNGTTVDVDAPSKLPGPNEMVEIQEPWLSATVVTPGRHIGAVMELVSARRGEFKRMEYLQAIDGGQGLGGAGLAGNSPKSGNSPEVAGRVLLEYDLPLAEMLAEFYDQLKSRTQGYASLDYVFQGYRSAPLVKLDILLNPGAC